MLKVSFPEAELLRMRPQSPLTVDQLIQFFVGPYINQPRYFAPLFMNERG